MGKRISLTLTLEDYEHLRAYLRQKRRWKDPASLARDAIFQLIARNPLTEAQDERARKGHGEAPVERSAVLREGS
jgi:hypothetical protein